ncbi:MAG: His/Gly/Thr/Pro-type tRNA ligase C-terminal domain-containing protein [Gemmatimonadota bacterium]
MTDQTVTVRHRDAMNQDRISLDQLRSWIGERITVGS